VYDSLCLNWLKAFAGKTKDGPTVIISLQQSGCRVAQIPSAVAKGVLKMTTLHIGFRACIGCKSHFLCMGGVFSDVSTAIQSYSCMAEQLLSQVMAISISRYHAYPAQELCSGLYMNAAIELSNPPYIASLHWQNPYVAIFLNRSNSDNARRGTIDELGSQTANPILALSEKT
jgi:hypothetical protein